MNSVDTHAATILEEQNNVQQESTLKAKSSVEHSRTSEVNATVQTIVLISDCSFDEIQDSNADIDSESSPVSA